MCTKQRYSELAISQLPENMEKIQMIVIDIDGDIDEDMYQFQIYIRSRSLLRSLSLKKEIDPSR